MCELIFRTVYMVHNMFAVSAIIVFVCILPEKAVPEMTYTVLGGTLNPTHSLTVSAIV